jgi:hypothetical protein
MAIVGFTPVAALAQGALGPPKVAPAPVVPVAPAAPTVTPAQPRITVPVVTPAPTVPQPTGVAAPSTSGKSADGKIDNGRPIVFYGDLRALPGVGLQLSGPGGTRQAVSDANGVLSLGKLSPGVHELTVNTRSVGTGTGSSSPRVIALLLPAVQQAREALVTHTIPADAGPELHIKLGVMTDGRVTSVTVDDGKGPRSVNVAAGDLNGDGVALKAFEDLAKRGAPGETRVAFAVGSPGVGSTSGGPQAVKGSTALVGVVAKSSVSWSGPGGRGRATPDANGLVPLGRLPQGTYDVTFEIPRTGGTQPTQQKVLIALLLPAVQKVRGIRLPLGAKGSVKFTVGADGKVTNANWYTNGGVTHEDTWDQQRLKGALPGVGGDTTFVFFDVNNVIAEIGTAR